jgi:hypothetical protein
VTVRGVLGDTHLETRKATAKEEVEAALQMTIYCDGSIGGAV